MYSSVALVTQDTSGTQFVTIFYITACLHHSSHILPIMKLGSDVRNEVSYLIPHSKCIRMISERKLLF